MKKNIAAAAVLFLALPVLAQEEAQEPPPSAGSAAADFLRVGVSARAAAMGEAFSALSDDASALYWNPAGLTSIERRSASFMHTAYFGSSSFDYGAYGQRIGQAAFGASVHYLSAGTIYGVDELNADSGTSYTPNDLAVTFGGAYAVKEGGAWGGFAAGAAVKLIRSSVIDTAQTAAADFGVLSPKLFQGRLRLAATLVNLGPGLKFGAEREPLPLAGRLGGAYRLSPVWAVSLDGVQARDEKPYLGLGTEYAFATGASWSLAGRGGFNSRSLDEGPGLSGGVGLGYKAIVFDYAFLPFEALGSTHRVSLTFKF